MHAHPFCTLHFSKLRNEFILNLVLGVYIESYQANFILDRTPKRPKQKKTFIMFSVSLTLWPGFWANTIGFIVQKRSMSNAVMLLGNRLIHNAIT